MNRVSVGRLVVLLAVLALCFGPAIAEDCEPSVDNNDCANAGEDYVISACDCWTDDCGNQHTYSGSCYFCCDVVTGNCI